MSVVKPSDFCMVTLLGLIYQCGSHCSPALSLLILSRLRGRELLPGVLVAGLPAHS